MLLKYGPKKFWNFSNLRKILSKTFQETYAAFTLSGFDDQEQNLTSMKTDFQVLKLKVHACNNY